MEKVLAVTDRVIDAHGADQEALVEILREANDESGHLTREQLAEDRTTSGACR